MTTRGRWRCRRWGESTTAVYAIDAHPEAAAALVVYLTDDTPQRGDHDYGINLATQSATEVPAGEAE